MVCDSGSREIATPKYLDSERSEKSMHFVGDLQMRAHSTADGGGDARKIPRSA
jgi:hypothetical protein